MEAAGSQFVQQYFSKGLGFGLKIQPQTLSTDPGNKPLRVGECLEFHFVAFNCMQLRWVAIPHFSQL
jgi:hypothetical protein